MAEYIRTIKVRIEVDTNKQTYAKEFEGESIGQIQRRLATFLDDQGVWNMPVGP